MAISIGLGTSEVGLFCFDLNHHFVIVHSNLLSLFVRQSISLKLNILKRYLLESCSSLESTYNCLAFTTICSFLDLS